jgi:hypothetical protein
LASRRAYTWASGDVCDVSGGQVRIASSVNRYFRNSNGKFILPDLYDGSSAPLVLRSSSSALDFSFGEGELPGSTLEEVPESSPSFFLIFLRPKSHLKRIAAWFYAR